MGVLTTAHTWQVYRYSLPDKETQDQAQDQGQDRRAKRLLEMVGQFRMPVLASADHSCSNSSSDGTTAVPPEASANASASASAVDAAAVERVMAMLSLCAQGQL